MNRPVKQLAAEVARKIAAGEVIDRPAAIVRELIDNAIDSGATHIAVEIESGGIESVRVVDDGSGMTKADLHNCARPHATSKIETETDLLKLSTLGFRGEALASIAAVCRLSITSGSWKMRASVTEDHIIEPCTPIEGTIVQAEGLFENFPARRRFLKRPASEMMLCKTMFIEKSLAHPDIAFTFTVDGVRKMTLTSHVGLAKRFVQAAMPRENESLFYEISGTSGGENPDWQFTCVLGEPGVSRTNKKDIYIFVNGRRITEYALMQAIEYGAQGFFPNGTYPAAALFVTMKSDLVDFNIHPAKKEARFHDISQLHHGASVAVRNFFHQYTVRTMQSNLREDAAIQSPMLNFGNAHSKASQLTDSANKYSTDNARAAYSNTAHSDKTAFGIMQHSAIKNRAALRPAQDFSRIVMKRGSGNFSQPYARSFLDKRDFSDKQSDEQHSNEKNVYYSMHREYEDKTLELAERALAEDDEQKNHNAAYSGPHNPFHFLGSALGTFLVAEKGNTLYIIDKHAAHERILYDKIMENQGKSQKLLVPYEITTHNDADDIYLAGISSKLQEAGVALTNKGNGTWEITAVPERWNGSESDLCHALLDKRIQPQEVISHIAATTACKAAVKDGCTLDDKTAAELAESALALPDPHCPHGRPVWTAVTREELFALVKRT